MSIPAQSAATDTHEVVENPCVHTSCSATRLTRSPWAGSRKVMGERSGGCARRASFMQAWGWALALLQWPLHPHQWLQLGLPSSSPPWGQSSRVWCLQNRIATDTACESHTTHFFGAIIHIKVLGPPTHHSKVVWYQHILLVHLNLYALKRMVHDRHACLCMVYPTRPEPMHNDIKSNTPTGHPSARCVCRLPSCTRCPSLT